MKNTKFVFELLGRFSVWIWLAIITNKSAWYQEIVPGTGDYKILLLCACVVISFIWILAPCFEEERNGIKKK